jgi:hypothetical protein
MDVDFPELPKFGVSNLENYYQETIVQLFFLLSRNDGDIDKIGGILEDVLCSIKSNNDFHCYLVLLFKMIAHTRDMVFGKGERKLTYMMIYIWYKFYPTLAIYALHQLVDIRTCSLFSMNNGGVRFLSGKYDLSSDDIIDVYCSSRISFGCWKDIKYLCFFLRSRQPNHPLIDVAIEIMNKQLLRDLTVFHILQKNGFGGDFRTVLSFAAKWIPRENTKFEWIFEKMAVQWAQMVTPFFFKNSLLTYSQNDALLKKCKMNYRNVCSMVNRALDTIEIKQCKGRWNAIEPGNIPKNTLLKQKNAFFNVNKNMETRSYEKDRRNCANTVKEYYKDLILSEDSVFCCNFEVGSFVKQCSLLQMESNDLHVIQNKLYQIDLLNKSWDSFLNKFETLHNFIPFLDIDSFGGPAKTLYSGIELAAIIASKSSLDGNIMFSNHVPIWKKFEKTRPFCENIQDVLQSINHDTNYMNRNILNAIDLFIHSLIACKTSKNDISKMVLVIITNKHYSDYAQFSFKFDKNQTPHMIFWNMSMDVAVPVVKNIEKTTFISGYNSLLLNHFRFMGFSGVLQFGSYDTVCNFLNNSRYDSMGDYIAELNKNATVV